MLVKFITIKKMHIFKEVGLQVFMTAISVTKATFNLCNHTNTATKNLYLTALLTVKFLILTLEHQHFPQKLHFLNIFIYKY